VSQLQLQQAIKLLLQQQLYWQAALFEGSLAFTAVPFMT
jgi:hypothetical protein